MRRSLLLALAMLGPLLAVPAQASTTSGWIVTCGYHHSAPEDPITAPGAVNGSHVHDFVGNRSAGASSTYASMTAAGSTCLTTSDTAGYWAPALYGSHQVVPTGGTTRNKIYYRANNLAAGTRIEPFPADLRIVAGNSKATSAAGNPELGKEIYWGCSDNSTGKLLAPPNCSTGIVSLHIGFPNCWDGVLTHVNDTAHLRYPGGGVCPTGFPHALPRLIERLEYPVGTNSAGLYLASGPTWTAHGDFWNTWNQATLIRLTTACFGATGCGTDPQ